MQNMLATIVVSADALTDGCTFVVSRIVPQLLCHFHRLKELSG
jgi:hypothetical protein